MTGACESSGSLKGWTHPVNRIYVASCDGTATASVCDSNFDTRIAIYPADCGSTTVIACNDDACGNRSEVSFPVEAGGEYLIRIGAVIGVGEGTLVVECAGG